ncbi:hypothetical protein EMIT0P253_50068 [Pseudomonas sp. IT-P253]
MLPLSYDEFSTVWIYFQLFPQQALHGPLSPWHYRPEAGRLPVSLTTLIFSLDRDGQRRTKR